MTLTDPRQALADHSDFIGYLVGLASLARVVQTLAADADRRAGNPPDADDFVHVLLGFASIGAAIERFAGSANSLRTQQVPAAESRPMTIPARQWLR